VTSHGHSHASEVDSKLTWSCASVVKNQELASDSEADDGNTRGLTPRLFNPRACRDFVINRPDK